MTDAQIAIRRVSLARHITAANNLLVHQFGEEAVILNLNNEIYYRLNEMAIRMWQVLTSSESLDQARETLLSEYDITADVLDQDLNEFIDNLKNLNMIEVHE
jgi:hypothetical protein